MKKLISSALIFFGSLASAYPTGDFECANQDSKIPPRIIKIRNINISTDEGMEVPYLEISRSFRTDPANPKSPLRRSLVKGIASVSQVDDTEVLMVASLRIEFKNGEMQNCRP